MPESLLSMRRSPSLPQALPFLALVLLFAPFATAQSGGTGVGPVDDTYAYVEYTVNNTVNPPNNSTNNGTSPPGNGTNPPGNGTNPPGNGTNPPGNGTNPPGNGTNPPGNGTNTPGNGTNPPGNGTAPGNETEHPAGNETDGNETVPDDPDGNETHDSQGTGNETGDGTSGGSGTGASGNGTAEVGTGGSSCGTCVEANVTVTSEKVDGDVGGELGSGDGSDETEACPSCHRSRPAVVAPTGAPGFPWLPLLITLTVAPLVGLLMARHAINRWRLGKPAPKPSATVQVGPKGPADAHDPMRKFLMDVKEWRAMPMPGSEPASPGSP